MIHRLPRIASLPALLLLSASLLAQTAPPPAGAPPAGGPPPAGQHRPMPKPTNLQVLPKNISGDELMKIMHGFQGALGVECVHCHVVNMAEHKADFASDAKPEKKTARLMMAMNTTINQKYITPLDPDAKVTCGTCHRGHNMPEAFVPPPEHEHEHGGPPPGAPGGAHSAPPGPPPGQ